MRILNKLLLVAFTVFLMLAILIFVLENRQPVALVFFGWSSPQLSLAVPVVLALLVGMLIGPLLARLNGLRKRRAGQARIV